MKTIKRNERERKRVEVVNNGFEALRKHVPTAAPVKKMSKVGILNEAMEYIQYLKTVLGASQSSEPVLLNYTQHIPAHPMPFPSYSQHSPASPQVPPHMQSQGQAFSPYPHQQTQASDQGFVSDYSQPSPAPAWHTPQAQYTPLTPHHHHGNQQVAHVSSSSHSSHYHNLKYHNDAESSGDEDDILDAIAEWQQQ